MKREKRTRCFAFIADDNRIKMADTEHTKC